MLHSALERSRRYASLQAILTQLDAAGVRYWTTRTRMLRWQCVAGNLEALSLESGARYVSFLKGLELAKEYSRLDSGAIVGAGRRERLRATTLAERFDSERDGLPDLGDAATRHEFLCELRDSLVASLSADGADPVGRACAGAVAAQLDPIFLPPDGRFEWRRWYEQLSCQVAREDELVHQRLTWMMQFEGFLFTAFSIAAGGRDLAPEGLRVVLLTLIPVVGLSGAYAVHRGVRSAHQVLDCLRRAYLASLERYKTSHVRPFRRHTEHREFVSLVFPWIMITAWTLILLVELGLWVSGDYHR